MKPIVKSSVTVLEALAAINESKNLTIFIIDDNGVLSGTLTDGDVRRYLLKGGQLSDGVMNAANKDYAKVFLNDVDVLRKLKEFKSRDIKQIPSVDDNGKIVDIYDLVNYKSHLPIDAVLMAGGKGERLRPLTEKTPKPLLPVGGKCIIDHNIDRLISYGIKHISVTVNYLKEQIESHYAEPRNGIKITTVREPQYLGTIGSIRFVEHFHNDAILIMNSDLFTNIDYEDFYLHFIENGADMSVAAASYNVSIPYGILDLDGRNIKGFWEKPKYNYYVNAGIYLIKKSVIAEIPTGQFFNATDLVERMIVNKKRVVRYPLNGTWIDIGTMQEYQKAIDLVKHLY